MQMEFTTLILVQVIPCFATVILLAFMVFKDRKLYPEEIRKPEAYKIPGGKFGTYLCTITISVVAVAAFYLNGTDYFLYGVFLILGGIILYVICKPLFGGCSVEHPDKWPRNPKTKLAYGDLYRIGILIEINIHKWHLHLKAKSVVHTYCIREGIELSSCIIYSAVLNLCKVEFVVATRHNCGTKSHCN
jgi:hypothetical protein